MNNADKLHELLSQINAKAQDVNGLVAEINNLAIEYEKVVEDMREINKRVHADFLGSYHDVLKSSIDIFFLDETTDIYSNPFIDCDGRYNIYAAYPTRDLAQMSAKLTKFNSFLLACKYCYDNDFIPDWADISQSKYAIRYDHVHKCYDVVRLTMVEFNQVVFSSSDIAQKIVDYLNSVPLDDDRLPLLDKGDDNDE